MRLRAQLMIMPAAWLLPPMLAIIWLYVSSSVTFEAREPCAIVPMGTVLNPVRALSPARQARWANRNIAAYWRCGVQAPLELR